MTITSTASAVTARITAVSIILVHSVLTAAPVLNSLLHRPGNFERFFRCGFFLFFMPLDETSALLGDPVPEHGTEHKILRVAKLREGFVSDFLKDCNAILVSEKDIEPDCADIAYDIGYRKPPQFVFDTYSVAAVKRMHDQMPQTFLEFIDMMGKYIHFNLRGGFSRAFVK